ncbi:hypothetical protein CGRA01v4_00449 [Colletotrichum graminicola]|uniref:Arrestin-like N-terminal domain-containing protein n=1 Tax=Colletotrichum graminicola (strain M1.001 / M2 / FGSC 10212) TaxID=645133 RepID=E3QH07_COLGM|nr:uncharacterized protein GLRG_05313 [Colletotrichum graminicola M1.001]EFQ30169.1 hypothetical protein GLRG_05313 [Colletotrichum graminicola M1.001]WDK09171.1 hypothetical protein CGRA01v4_00449 [Colletotrichum graminicola]
MPPPARLHGGSVVEGQVIRRLHIVAPSATVVVRLHGRAKAKLSVDRGNNDKSHYRGRFDFWPGEAVCEVLHRGPIHIAPGAGEHQAWTFTLTLPTYTDGRYINATRSSSARQACFLPLADGAGEIPGTPLPGSFYLDCRGFSKSWHAFVEYWIEAELSVQGKGPVARAVLPIKVFSPPTPAPPISDFGLARRTISGCVTSQRLFPGMEEAQLSLKQKTHKFFGSSKVPAFHFTLDVRSPTVIQMGNDTSIPFLLQLRPDGERTTDAIRDVPQTVTIQSMKLEIQSRDEVICPGTLSPHEVGGTLTKCIARIDGFYPQRHKIVMSSGPKEEPLDLGAVLNLRVDALGRVLHGGGEWRESTGREVLPTFVTYCIKIQHTLHWKMQLSMAGESWRCQGAQRLLILAPCEDMASGRVETSAMAALSLVPPPPVVEEAPAYDGPKEAAPAYEKVGGDGEDKSAVEGKS